MCIRDRDRFVALICEKNDITGHYVEPYAGGASVALYLLFNGYVKEVTINDLDRSIYAFWHSILNHTRKFCSHIEKTEVTLKNWDRFKRIQERKESASLFKLGFSTFFLNRTNRSGIINGGMIGGRKQNSPYPIDCRFNKEALIERIKRISKYKDRIHLQNLDALVLVQKLKTADMKNTIFYFDPPYYLKGPSLYLDHYAEDDHEKVANAIQGIKGAKWIVSYDNAPEIDRIYSTYKKKEYLLFHTAHSKRKSTEVLFFSENLKDIDVPLTKIKVRNVNA